MKLKGKLDYTSLDYIIKNTNFIDGCTDFEDDFAFEGKNAADMYALLSKLRDLNVERNDVIQKIKLRIVSELNGIMLDAPKIKTIVVTADKLKNTTYIGKKVTGLSETEKEKLDLKPKKDYIIKNSQYEKETILSKMFEEQARKERKAKENSVKPDKGKYKDFIRDVYTNFPEGLRYMQMVEYLYDGTVGLWDKKKRYNCRGLASTNLNGSHSFYNNPKTKGILKKYFRKYNGKYVPIYELKERIFSSEFKPFSDNTEVSPVDGLYYWSIKK